MWISSRQSWLQLCQNVSTQDTLDDMLVRACDSDHTMVHKTAKQTSQTKLSMYCPQLPTTCRCCSNRSISPARRAHSSKPAAADLVVLWHCQSTEGTNWTIEVEWISSTQCASLKQNKPALNYTSITSFFIIQRILQRKERLLNERLQPSKYCRHTTASGH